MRILRKGPGYVAWSFRVALLCWLVGHRWRFVGRFLGPGRGYHYPERWRYKCDRCLRKRATHEAQEERGWWLQSWDAAVRFCGDWWFHAFGPYWRPRDGYAYSRAPWWVRVGFALTAAPAFAAYQAYGCNVRFLPLPFVLIMDALHDAGCFWSDFWDRYIERYSWVRTEDHMTWTGGGPPPTPHGIHWRREWGPAPRVWKREYTAEWTGDETTAGSGGVVEIVMDFGRTPPAQPTPEPSPTREP